MTAARRALYGTILAALVIRLAIWPWFAQVRPRIYDEGDYIDIATSLAQDGAFAMNGRITSARPPLYPAMVAAIYRVAGVGNHQAVRLFQILINVATLPLVFALGRRLYDERTGLVAAVLTAFYPSLLGHDYLILTEVLFTFLLVAGTLALVEYAARPHWGWIALAGVAFGLGTLARTPLLFYPPLFAITIFAFCRSPSSRRIAAVLLFTAVFAVVLAPWIARNSLLNGRLSSVDSYSNSTAARFSPLRHLLERGGSTRLTTAWWNREGGFEPTRRRGREREGGGEGAGEPKRSKGTGETAAAGSSAPEGRRSHPHQAEGAGHTGAPALDQRAAESAGDPVGAATHLARAGSELVGDVSLFWRIDRELAGAASRGWMGPLSRPMVVAIAVVVAVYYVLLMLAGVLGLVLRPPSDRLQLALVLSVVAVIFAVHSFSLGHSRYHIPLMPLVCVFAARLWVARGEPVPARRLIAGITLASVLVATWVVSFFRFDLTDVREHLSRSSHAAQPKGGGHRRGGHG